MGNRLWRIACILNTTPWDDRILNLTVPQSNWLLAMYAKEHKDEYKLVTPTEEMPVSVYKRWEERLSGEAKMEFMRNPNAFLWKHYKYSPYDK